MRIAIIAAWILSSACLYNQDVEENYVSCSSHSECGEKQRCGGMVSSDEACVVDGFLGVDDDGIFPDRPTDQDSVFFQCDQGRRYYSYCTNDWQSVCDDSVGGAQHLCGKPLDGSSQLTYPVALRAGTDDLWQCNPDMTCNDPNAICLRMFEYNQDGYKSNRRVCVPLGMVGIPPPWLR